MAEKSILQNLKEDSSAEVMTVIYEKVNDLLGAGNQMFAMEFPARPLNSRNYEYSVDDCYSTLTKPYPVQEAEFLLSDQLYDVSPIVQGPNGERLSTVFDTVMNNFVPKLETLKTFVNDQKNLRTWLSAHVVDEINGEKRELSRMAIAKELYGQFLKKRNEWVELKNKTYDEYKKNNDLDGYARWLSSEGLVKEEELNNYYNDAVVRGNFHEVMTLLGFLNVSSPSEALENTKKKMRASLRRSLDGSTDVYPVQFQPSDWFKALRPNMSPKDLTMATDSLIADYKAKEARLRSLTAQLAEQSVLEVSKEEQERLANEITSCEEKLRESEQNLIAQYGSGVVSAVKAVVNIYKEVKDPSSKAQETIKKIQGTQDKSALNTSEKRIYALIEDIASDVVDSVIKTCKAQEAIQRDLKRLTDTRMAYAESKVKDMRLQKLRIEEQIKNVQADLDFLKPLISGTIAESEKKDGQTQEDSLMTDGENEAQDNNFMDVVIKSDESGSFMSSSSSASSSHSSWGVGGWFWSGSRQKSSSQGQEEQKRLEMNKKLEIGFRIKKVTFDRGGWFNPTIMKLSNNYYRLADIRFSQGIDKEKIRAISANGQNVEGALRDLVTYNAVVDGQNKKMDYVLPAFPTGFAIAKDITIRIQCSKQESESSRQYMESSESSSGGFFCFRGGSSSSSKSSSESAYFGSSDNYFYIRIPGPQILGWFLEFTPSDNSTPYKQLEAHLYEDDLNRLVPVTQNSEQNGKGA